VTARIALICALLAFAGCTAACSRRSEANAGTFALTLYHRREEISKDSNEEVTEIAIDGRRVTYSWTYSGFHPDPDYRRQVRKRARLSQREIEAIQETIRTHDLLQTVQETQPLTDLGIVVEIDLAVEMDGQMATTRIQGMHRIHGRSGIESNLAHMATVSGVDVLVSQIRSMVVGR
jgi:hypothetical protein